MTAPDDPALFPTPSAGIGPVEAAMLDNLDVWNAAAVKVGPAQRASLIAQARAVDMALRAGRPTNVSGANRVLMELLSSYHLLGDAVPAGDGTPALSAFLAGVEEFANGQQPPDRP